MSVSKNGKIGKWMSQVRVTDWKGDVIHKKKSKSGKQSQILERSVSTISTELKRHSNKERMYSAVTAQKTYEKRRVKCKRKRLLSNEKLRFIVKRLFLEEQWSPEEIAIFVNKLNNRPRKCLGWKSPYDVFF